MLKTGETGSAEDAHYAALFERLAVAAGKLILSIRDAGISVSRKEDCSPVTEADLKAEALIRRGIADTFRSLPIVAEEEVSGGRVPGNLGGAFVLVDPLDGTREFVAGRSDFTVNIALVRDGHPTIGVVLAPARRVLFSGRPGIAERIGLSADGEPESRQLVQAVPPAMPIRIVASRSHRTPETDTFIAGYAGAELVAVGSSLKFCLLAAGEADLYPRFGRTMEWDTAAGDAVLRAAGGMTETLDGAPLIYGKRRQKDDSDFANPWFIARGA